MIGSKLATRWAPSPNWRPRGQAQLRFVILHGTYMSSDEQAIARLRDPATQVSSHYLITRTGEVVQLVDEDKSAFHAGLSQWDGIQNLNDWSLGIELGNTGPFGDSPSPEAEKGIPDWSKVEPYTAAQYASLIALLKDIQSRHPQITPQNVLGHSDVSPGRKTDPGEHFDWQQLISAGVCARP